MMSAKTIGIAMFVMLASWLVAVVGAAEPTTKPATQPSTSPSTQPSTQPAKELTLDLGNKVTMKLVLIPAGKFMMGSPKDEKDHHDHEVQHEVTISKPYYMGVYEVTQEQYEQIIGKNPSNFKGAQNPVETVSWTDAVEFCKTLSKKTGKTVHLPTEAQWEYACRAGTKTRFGSGDKDEDLGDYAWYGKNSDGKTHPVSQKKANDWGLYDMHGNVWELCSDWYGQDYYSAKANNHDPQGPASGALRVLRGGSWYVDPLFCRSAYRVWDVPGSRGSHVGFRVVVDTDFSEQSTRPASQPATAPASMPTTASVVAFKEVVLQDVQPLWGGRDVHFYGNGRLIVQTVKPGQPKPETRYEMTLPAEDVAAMAALIVDHKFSEIKIAARPGVPDEARPTITVYSADGKKASVSKWARDKNKDFDAIYKWLLNKAATAEKTTPTQTGAYKPIEPNSQPAERK